MNITAFFSLKQFPIEGNKDIFFYNCYVENTKNVSFVMCDYGKRIELFIYCIIFLFHFLLFSNNKISISWLIGVRY